MGACCLRPLDSRAPLSVPSIYSCKHLPVGLSVLDDRESAIRMLEAMHVAQWARLYLTTLVQTAFTTRQSNSSDGPVLNHSKSQMTWKESVVEGRCGGSGESQSL